jgi:hypothetical protein
MKFQMLPDASKSTSKTLFPFACVFLGNTPLIPGPLPEKIMDVMTHLVCCYTDNVNSSVIKDERHKLLRSLIDSCDSLPEEGSYTAAIPQQLRVYVLGDNENEEIYTHCLSVSHPIIKDISEKNKIAAPCPGYYYMTGRCWVMLSNPLWRLKFDDKGVLGAVTTGSDQNDCSIRILITDMNITSKISYKVRDKIEGACRWNDFKQYVSSWFSFLD